MGGRSVRLLWILLSVFVVLNATFWFCTNEKRTRWMNVPPVPGKAAVMSFGIGDAQLAYRVIAIMLQNLGDTGGRVTALRDYDYNRLVQWFYLEDSLDPVSNFVPALAAYYFGAVDKAESAAALVDYLSEIGQRGIDQKWRWLAHAVHLARFQMNYPDKAYALAQELAHLPDPEMPIWTRQMPAFILNASGKKEAAYDIMVEILRSSNDSLPPEEIAAMTDYICKRLLDANEALNNPICNP